MKKRKLILVLGFSSILIGGCASKPDNTEELKVKKDILKFEEMASEERGRLHDYIKEITDKAITVQKERRDIESALTLPQLDADKIREAMWQFSYVPVGMDRVISVDQWNAPPEPLLNTLANYAKYEITYTNNKPPIDKTISINAENKNLKYLIDEVQRQSVGYIKDIKIMEDIKHIVVDYEDY